MRNILKYFSYLVLIIAFLNVFAWAVFHASTGGQKLGSLTNFIKQFANFPVLVNNVINEVKSPERKIEASVDNFEEINKLSDDLYSISAIFLDGKWTMGLKNLKNDSVIHTWYLEGKDFYKTSREFSNSAPYQPIILEDSSLVFSCTATNNIYRISSDSKIIWHNKDLLYHHSINLDHSGNIWICTGGNDVVFSNNNVKFKDEFITKVDVNTGEALYNKSISEIFKDNGLDYLIFGMGNIVNPGGDDPIHLNDIEPVMSNGKYWKKGDVFVSLRHRSMVFLYRPETNKIIRVIQGGFYNQHDVDIQTDSTISIFNNNTTTLDISSSDSEGADINKISNSDLNVTSGVVVYNMADSSFTSLYHNQFKENSIYTRTEGLHHILANGDLFVEESNKGIVYIINENETILRKYYYKPTNGYVDSPNWVRIYESIDFLN